MRMAHKLRDIVVRKIDLVGAPAIGKPIVLFKSQDGGTAVEKEQLLKAVDALDDEGRQELLKALGVNEPPDPVEALKGLPEEQRAEIAKLLVGEPKALTAEEVIKAIQDAMPKKEDGDDKVPESVRKSLEAFEARIKKADERADKAETRVAELEKARERERYVAEVGAFKHLPGMNADDFASILAKADGTLTEEERKKLRGVLKGANEALKDSELLKEWGSGQRGGSGDVHAELDSLAVELRKSKPDLSIEQAKTKIMSENPELARRLLEEEDAAKRERR